MKKTTTYFELEAGSITIKIINGELKFLTIYRVKMDDYTFPKGHVEEKESLETAARRETLEETGYPVKIKNLLDSFEYIVNEEKYGQKAQIIRRVYYFTTEAVGEKLSSNNPDKKEGEIISSWLTYDEVMPKLKYETDKNLIKKVFAEQFKNLDRNDYSKIIYAHLLKIIADNQVIKKELLKIGLVGSVNDNEATKDWSDIDILFLLKSDPAGNLNIDTLVELRRINLHLTEYYPDIEISFLPHTYDDLEKYVSFGYLENYKFANFDIDNDKIDFKNYIENIIKKRQLDDEIRKRYSVYHLRHFRFNLIRKILSTKEDKMILKMIIDKIIETMILCLNYYGIDIKGKYARLEGLKKLKFDNEIINIYSAALEKRANWSKLVIAPAEVREWLINFKKIETYMLAHNNYNVPEEFINNNAK